MEKSKQVDQAFEKFKSDFGQVMNDLARGMAEKMTTDGVDESKITHKPIAMKDAAEAAKFMIGCKHVMVLSGAGLSAASGIPTFRGSGGFWTSECKYKGYSDPEVILTMDTFRKDPDVVWLWHYDFIELMKKCSIN